MLSLYFAHYNFVRVHRSVRMTPAVAADVSKEPYGMEWLAKLTDAAAPKPRPRGTYRERQFKLRHYRRVR